jgi:nicotinate phosphoribosyltransferase
MGNFLYKQGYLKEIVGWSFFNRNGTKFPLGYASELQKQVDSWQNLVFTDEILSHMEKTLYWLDYFYIWAYLKTYKFDTSCIKIFSRAMGDHEEISVSYEGEWGKIIFYEIFLLATMSELYNIMSGMNDKIISTDEQAKRNSDKISRMAACGAKVAEFGTRRRYSKEVQERLLKQMIAETPTLLTGTSNLMFARQFKITPIGTIGHELIMFMGAKYNPSMADSILMSKWVEVYQGALGIYLPDTYTTNHFLRYFDLLNSKLWDGVREDSAPDTDKYVDMIIEHYKKLRIDPSTKLINHSNTISSVEQVEHMQQYRQNEIRRAFGIGTWLTNDVYPANSDLKPVDWVIKMTYVYADGHKKYCVKISDSPGKVTSIDEATIKQYLFELNLDDRGR